MAYITAPAIGKADAQVFNLAPYLNLYLQEQQQKKAESRAIDKQIADDLARYTPDGLRQQDVPQFLDQYQNLKNLSIQYRDAIRNPAKNPKAWSEYQSAKNRLTGLIAESKAAKENTKSLYDFRGRNYDKLDDDAFKSAMTLYNAPIGTPEHDQAKDFDQSQLVFKEATFDMPKWQTFLNNAVKPVDRIAEEPLPTGQRRQMKVRYTDPLVLANVVGQSFDNNLVNSKKFYTSQFENASEDQLQELEDYTSRYIPDFKINNAKDFAVASNLYGQVEKDMGTTTAGSPYLANQAFQREQQNRQFAHSEKMQREKAAKDEKDKYIWETEMSKYMQSGDTKNVRRLASELESSSPGVERVFLKEGETTQGALNTFKRELKKNGVDGKTKFLTDADFKKGVLVVAVPKFDKDKNVIPNQYEYLAVSSRDPSMQNRLNKIRNFAIGGQIKPLTDKIYEDQPIEESTPIYNLDELSPTNEEEQ